MNLPRLSDDHGAEQPPKFDRGVSCLCWAHNERPLIEGFIARLDDLLRRTVEDYEIVVIDDGSTDGTREVLRALSQKNPRIVLGENEKNLNVGHCFRRAVKAARKEFLFWQTVDWSYDLANLRRYLELLREFDVVAGSRWEKARFFPRLFSPSYLRARSDSLPKALVSIANYLLVRLLFRLPLTDYQNTSIYPTALIRSFEYESDSSFANPESLFRAYWRGMRIAEVPVGFIPRAAGRAKGTRLKAVRRSVADILSLWWRWMVLRRFDFQKRGEVFRPGAEQLGRRLQRLKS